MVRKKNKLECTSAKEYQIICLLNFLREVYEKVVADMLAKWCKVNHVLHSGIIGSRRQRSTIELVT